MDLSKPDTICVYCGTDSEEGKRLRSCLALSDAVVEAVITDTRKWYAEDIFGPVDEAALKEIHRLYPGTVDRLSADMARRTCDLVLSNYQAALKEVHGGTDNEK